MRGKRSPTLWISHPAPEGNSPPPSGASAMHPYTYRIRRHDTDRVYILGTGDITFRFRRTLSEMGILVCAKSQRVPGALTRTVGGRLAPSAQSAEATPVQLDCDDDWPFGLNRYAVEPTPSPIRVSSWSQNRNHPLDSSEISTPDHDDRFTTPRTLPMKPWTLPMNQRISPGLYRAYN